ncbi:archaellin/type IV pilin N-terminal domain-containing protein [Caldisphaera sp.]|uniref:archaellin/type IV pilin N-terminal domain-containing protein n=1 Tax=Caldisphaera sp. TaxID=2060322 RepID=UPI003D0AAED8
MKYTIKGLSMKRSNKAISDIVAVVMLILIAIAAAVLIYLWLSGLVGSVHSSNPALTERISIASVAFNVAPKISSNIKEIPNITAYVQNTGSTSVTISSIYIINATSGSTLNNGTVFYYNSGILSKGSVTIPPNSIANVTAVLFGLSQSSLHGTPIIVEVVTSNGVQATYQTTWP